MRLPWPLLPALLLAPAPVAAQSVDANALNDSCVNEAAYSSGFCAGYIAGLTDLLLGFQAQSGTQTLCIPATMPLSDIEAAVVHTLQQNPNATGDNAALLVSRALVEAFPCR